MYKRSKRKSPHQRKHHSHKTGTKPHSGDPRVHLKGDSPAIPIRHRRDELSVRERSELEDDPAA